MQQIIWPCWIKTVYVMGKECEHEIMEDYNYGVALITATKRETAAVMQMYDWREKNFDNDVQTYYEAAFVRDGKPCRIVTTQQNAMGMTAAATLSMKLIEHFRPRYLIAVGITAGVALEDVEEQMYGDVVVADEIWDYATGKFVSPKESEIRYGNVGFLPRPAVIRMNPELRRCVEKAARSEENQCHVFIGAMATGSAVVANREVLDKQIHSQFRHTVGLDMEAYGIAYAAENATAPRPAHVIIKSVSDFADNNKNDQYQKFAAYTSAEFARLLFEKYLPMDEG